MPTENANQSQEQRFKAELEASQNVQILLELSPLDLLYIIGPLQLALRHPAFPIRNREFILQFIRRVKTETQIARYPAICEVIDMGFDPAFDTEPRRENAQ